MSTSNFYTTSANTDEIQYVKDMYKLRDYVLFFVKEEKEKEICILFDGKNISYGSKTDGQYHEMESFSAKTTSLNTIIDLLTREYNNYTSVSKDMGSNYFSVEANILKIGNAFITIANLNNIKSKFTDIDFTQKLFEEIANMFR